jgi:hypothetical protein
MTLVSILTEDTSPNGDEPPAALHGSFSELSPLSSVIIFAVFPYQFLKEIVAPDM